MALSLSPEYIGDVAKTLGLYALLFPVFYGWGVIGSYALHLELVVRPITQTVWLGWAFALVVLQAIHLFWAIDYRVTTVLFLTGLAMFAFAFSRELRQGRRKWTSLHSVYALVMLFTAIWVASKSMLPRDGDIGLYYLNTIRWINSYPIIPGLGNLHQRLAFNNSLFLHGASLNFFPYFTDGFRMANGFVFLLFYAELGWRAIAAVRKPGALLQAHPVVALPYLLILPCAVIVGVTHVDLSSSAPDSLSILLVFEMLLMLTQTLNASGKSAAWRDTLKVLAFLAAVAVTIKLSNLAFAVCIFAIAAYCCKSYGLTERALVVSFAVPAMLVICIWAARGYVLSGLPLYPTTVLRIPFEWAVPKASVEAEAEWIYGWARAPGPTANLSRQDWSWFRPWFVRVAAMTVDVVQPLAFGVTMLLLSIVASIAAVRKRVARPQAKYFLLPVPAGVALIYWFVTVPDPKFAMAQFWAFAVGSSLLFLSVVYAWPSKRLYAAAVVGVFIGLNGLITRSLIRHPELLTNVSTTGFIPYPNPDLVERQTLSRLRVYIPAERTKSDKCWDAPLPCTPYFDPYLRLRKNDLRSGFTVTPH